MQNNNPMGMIMQLMAQGKQNPQAFAQQLINSNPDFAKAIQGQNPQELAMRELQRRGINPQQIMQMFRR